MSMTNLGRPWLAFETTGSGLDVGLVSVAQGLPMLILAPLGGVAADRFPKRYIMLTAQATLLLATLVTAALVLTGVVQIWHLMAISFIHGCVLPFEMPVRNAFLPSLLDRQLLPNGVALNSTVHNLNQIASPSIAGVILAWDPGAAFIVMSALHGLAALTTLRLPLGAPQGGNNKSVFGDLAVGLRYVAGSARLRMLILVAFLAMALAHPYQQLLPTFQEVLSIGPARLGYLFAAAGMGALLGSLSLAAFSHLATRSSVQVLAGVTLGAALVAFALSPNYLLSLGLLFLVGLAQQSYMTINQTALITTSDPALYGRVMSVLVMIRASAPLAVLPLGALVDTIGAPGAIASAGTILAFTILTMRLLWPAPWQR
jgi:MFS family permease